MSEGPAAALENEPSIKRTVGRVLFEMLRQDGHRACDAWLRERGGAVGQAVHGGHRRAYLAPGLPMASGEALVPAS